MKILSIVLISFFFVACNKENDPVDCGLKAETNTGKVSLNVLFIGTSHTHWNDLPALVNQLAASMGDSVIRKQRIEGAFVPAPVTVQVASAIQETIAAVLFDCNPPWKDF